MCVDWPDGGRVMLRQLRRRAQQEGFLAAMELYQNAAVTKARNIPHASAQWALRRDPQACWRGVTLLQNKAGTTLGHVGK